MDNDTPLVPRNRAIPVRATRADAPLNIPNAPFDPNYPPQPHPAAPQPYVVIINPSAPAPPAPIQQPAPTQTFQTTHHHHYSSRARVDRGHSVLGMASLALGIIACVVCWMPVLGLAAVPIGIIGALLGFVGFLFSALFRRSSVALPAGGIFVCLLAAAISIASTGSLVYWRKHLQKLLPPSITSSSPLQTSTIHSPTAAATPTDPKVLSANQQLSAAVTQATERFLNSDAYRQANQQIEDARTRAAQLRAEGSGSSVLNQADQEMIDLTNALTGLKESAIRSDPSVLAAQQQLSELHHPTTSP